MSADGGESERLAYTRAEIAAASGLSRKAIDRVIAVGELRAAKVCGGSRLLVPADEAREWVARNLVRPAPRIPVRPTVRSSRRPQARPLTNALRDAKRAP